MSPPVTVTGTDTQTVQIQNQGVQGPSGTPGSGGVSHAETIVTTVAAASEALTLASSDTVVFATYGNLMLKNSEINQVTTTLTITPEHGVTPGIDVGIYT